jgi:hypothetical protein
LLSEAEVRPAGDLGELGKEDPGTEGAIYRKISTAGFAERGESYRKLSMAGLILAIPITLIVFTDGGILTFSSILFLLMMQGPHDRQYYQPRLRLDPRINAALLIERRKTGLTISEIAEIALRDYFSRDPK